MAWLRRILQRLADARTPPPDAGIATGPWASYPAVAAVHRGREPDTEDEGRGRR